MGELEDLIKQGDISYEKEKFIDSIRAYTKALEIGGDSHVMADLHYKLSRSYHDMDRRRSDESLLHGKKALEMHRSLNDRESVIGDLMNLAYIMQDSNNIKSAEEYIKESMKEAGDDMIMQNEIKLTLADILSSSKKRMNEALALYRDISEASEKSEDYEIFFTAEYGIISIMKDRGEIEGAYKLSKEMIDKIDSICSKIKNKKERKEFRKSVSFMYDIASDLAMDMERVTEAIEIAERMNRD
ncbi:MAG: hypothetical protein M1402_01960 [Candidatus Thermoplasmatota archaeon]|nr:hypothetical protein [Candidatus Thermoplasmatota archaeon]MCL5665523.1 hypothetical protein [Candidatus Thermoplasmatota archaeon]